MHIKRRSTSLIRKMQIKTTMRYHLKPFRMSIIKKNTNNKYWQGYREKGNLIQCWWKCKLVQLLWKTVGLFLKKLKSEIANNSTPGYISEKSKNTNLKRYMQYSKQHYLQLPRYRNNLSVCQQMNG